MPIETTPVVGFEIKKTILRIGVPNSKFSEDYARYLWDSVQKQLQAQDISEFIPIVVPEDTTLDTVYI